MNMPFDPIHYIKGVLLNNTFLDFEVEYYRGESNKNPHGLPGKLWQLVSNEIGFCIENMQTDGILYWLDN